ncbi:MAG: pyridoxal phosphate-dependent aminotransferase [Clostridia bacterium]|nr:pyridoxal phosphate-dependent aminotransferase [Clostridia bacterium]
MSLSISSRARNIAPSVTLAIDARAKELRANGQDVIGFGVGEPDFPTPAHICDAAREALDLGLTKYTPSAGTKELRKAICEKLRRDNDMTYTYGDIIVSNGAKHSIYNILQCILDQGDEVLIPTPCWVSYPEMVRMAGGVPIFVPSGEENNFIPTGKAIASRVTRRTKAIILTSPSNPNGSVWEKNQLQFVADLAISHPFYVISDEIYEKLIYDGREHFSIAQLGEDIKAHTFIVNGMSKAYAMTGWRIGYTAGPRDVINAMTSYQSQSTSNPNAIAQYAALKALQGDQTCVKEMVAEFEQRRNVICERINAIEGLSCRKPQGAFYVMMNIGEIMSRRYHGRTIESSLDFAELLLADKQVAVVPGIAFEAEGFCRLSYATSLENINKGLDRIEDFVRNLR